MSWEVSATCPKCGTNRAHPILSWEEYDNGLDVLALCLSCEHRWWDRRNG